MMCVDMVHILLSISYGVMMGNLAPKCVSKIVVILCHAVRAYGIKMCVIVYVMTITYDTVHVCHIISTSEIPFPTCHPPSFPPSPETFTLKYY